MPCVVSVVTFARPSGIGCLSLLLLSASTAISSASFPWHPLLPTPARPSTGVKFHFTAPSGGGTRREAARRANAPLTSPSLPLPSLFVGAKFAYKPLRCSDSNTSSLIYRSPALALVGRRGRRTGSNFAEHPLAVSGARAGQTISAGLGADNPASIILACFWLRHSKAQNAAIQSGVQ